ncbi:hypothetical protein EUTSA_v10029100mg [Eutrema salsugineum]|uniref:Uncharacterized protein n=1 Tax=Eutrema salsugineum TaxID=72664 RepID=V4N0U3_EUTSA|nr:hypothetical protein EUTSA_v10029100mg [Eutrema salsugineum]
MDCALLVKARTSNIYIIMLLQKPIGYRVRYFRIKIQYTKPILDSRLSELARQALNYYKGNERLQRKDFESTINQSKPKLAV